MVRFSDEKSWFTAIPLDEFPMSVMVLLLIVIEPAAVDPEAIAAIPLSLHPVIRLSDACRVKVSVTGVARTAAEPPLFEKVFVEAVTSRFANAPEVCM